jgi:hypothetical protein
MAVTKILIFLFVLIFFCRFAYRLQVFKEFWIPALGKTFQYEFYGAGPQRICCKWQ